MTTFVEVLPATKSSKNTAIRWTPWAVPGTGELVIEDRRTSTTYRVSEQPCDWTGTAARLVKVKGGSDDSAGVYDVFVAATPGEHNRCDCRGFERFSHCKHCSAVKALIQNRWLSRAAFANPDADVSNTEVHDQSEPAPAARPVWVPECNADLQGGF